MKRIALIGGTGWDVASLKSTFKESVSQTVHSRWGEANVLRCSLPDRELIFLHRHLASDGNSHLPPHRINYQANIAALEQLQVERIFACSAVGSLHANWTCGSLALLDQVIDFTSGRKSTFYDDESVHVDMTSPYDEAGKARLMQAAHQLGKTLHQNATYLCTNGPRFETAAEIRMFANWGADVVGMTAMPEVALARELAIPYTAIAVVTNAAAGISENPLTHQEVQEEMKHALPGLMEMMKTAALLG